ncbi:MAG: DUF2007 domain-containing protein [Bacteroidetes bacterium]|jgi:hypothetical protein|nr:DUF2007 domain-containing protein [Bacteroidota bacterium]MBT6686317.1 DUF2007 domain-containing protein [Bacteroidota bacterium]MBT7142150.1 DUF2007 domain-containing protein [Bacteroidota bacterium]MBT7490495.1 DUF2007 domain-containing protein [Bacteroidota bacterium]
MEKDLKLVYSTNKNYQAIIIRNLLIDNNIDSKLLNKKDSLIPTIGELEVYVDKKDEKKAKSIIKEF